MRRIFIILSIKLENLLYHLGFYRRRSQEYKFNKALYKFYKEAYKLSTPSANFDELCKNAIVDKEGKKHIPYDNYVLDRDVYESLVKKYSKKLEGSALRSFRLEAYLGCGPRTTPRES